MNVLIYEDNCEKLTPLTHVRPVFELRCGFHLLIDRLLPKLDGHTVGLGVREYLEPLVRSRSRLPVNDQAFFQGDVALVNGRWLIGHGDELDFSREAAYLSGGRLVYAVLKAATVKRLWSGGFAGLVAGAANLGTQVEVPAMLIEYPWNLIHLNPGTLRQDFAAAGKTGVEGTLSPQAVVHGPKDQLYVAPGAEVHPLVVLDTTAGPIYIDRKAKVFPNSRVEGPAYLGEDVQVMPGSSIREGNSFGPVCRVGGEVEESIFQGYGNKYHDGFIGHSYVCEFVNLGALTTNSDLKNDYTSVSVYVNGEAVETGDMKVGSFIGDHTKTSIGVLLNTGTSVGVMCNITAGGILPKYFPPFVWYVNGKYLKGFGFQNMMETVRAAMGRRKRICTPQEEQVLKTVYEMTRDIRQKYVRKSLRRG